MDFAPTPVRRPREQVESQLRSAILDGTFESGARLPSETDLATQFNVSRTTVREALRSLANDGLLDKLPGARGGTFVRTVDSESLSLRIRDSVSAVFRFGTISLAEMIAVREYLELPACELAATNRTAGQLKELRGCLDAAKDIPYDDPRSEQLHVRFHTVIGEASHNRLVSSFVTALHGIEFDIDPSSVPDDYAAVTNDHHQKIFRAIEKKDPAAVRRAMSKHLDYLRSLYLS